MKDDRQVLVACHDDGIGQNHDQAMDETDATTPVRETQGQITSSITKIGEALPEVRMANVTGGVLRITLTEYPSSSRQQVQGNDRRGAVLFAFPSTVRTGRPQVQGSDGSTRYALVRL